MQVNYDQTTGLVPAIIQDANTRKVLMLGYMNAEALDKTIKEQCVTFYSRSKKRLWTKGETSGNFLRVLDIKADCDSDTLLIQVHPDGPTCHTGTDTCWGQRNDRPIEPSSLLFLGELQDFIERRKQEMPEGSYTTSLFRDGVNKMAQKVGEEALELLIEATNGTNERLLYEGADMIYHLLVLLTSKGLRIEQMLDELASRHTPTWHKH